MVYFKIIVMKKVFIIAAFAGLTACNEPEVHIMGTQHDYTEDIKFVPDSVFRCQPALY